MPILLLGLLLHLFASTDIVVVSTPGGVGEEPDTLRLSLAPGDTAVLRPSRSGLRATRGAPPEGGWIGGDFVLAPTRPGVHRFSFGPWWRWWRSSRPVRLDVLPRRTLRVPLRRIRFPELSEAFLSRVSEEASRLAAPLGIRVQLEDSGELALPASPRPFWDREGDGFLDMRRNMDSAAPHPELDSLARFLSDSSPFPSVVLVGLPSRTGWSLARPLASGDSILVLDRAANLPWRDERGAPRSYVLAGRKGERADTFIVRSYRDGTHDISWTTPVRKRPDHPSAIDWVTLPDFDPGVWGFRPWWVPAAPILAFPSLAGALPERHLARLIAREIAYSLGIPPHPEGRNLLCPMLRMDIPDPEILPEQWRRLLSAP
ncbi:MAG: hypothetical protein H6686_12190 [Fibrobacteria bacterium]|nr:hypothetical protein [Fibrobacteria bacterium]